MRAPDGSRHSSRQGCIALLLTAILGGIAVFGVVFAQGRHNQGLVAYPDRMTHASGGLPASNAPFGNSPRPASCTPADQNIFGRDVVVDTQQWYCDRITVYGGNITVLGRVGSDVVSIGGNIVVSGEVDGRATALGGNVTLLPGARIGGDVQAMGGKVSRSPGVSVGGQVDRDISTDQFSLPSFTNIIPVRLNWADVLFWAFSGLVISLFLPSQLVRVRLIAHRQPLGSLFIGLAAYITGLISALVLVLTCLGIPLALAIGVVLWGGSIFGTASLGLWLGSALIPGAREYKRVPFILATVVGVTMLAIASTAPVIGGIIRLLVSSVGLGAVLLTLATMHRPATVRRALR